MRVRGAYRLPAREALTDIASRLATILDQQGPAAVAVNYGNPPAFGLGGISGPPLFMAAIGAHKAFSPQTEDTSAPLLAHQLLYGATSYVFPDLPDCEHLLIFGSNPLVSHGSLIIAPRLREDLDAVARRGRVIVVDPRRTESARKYEHVQVRPDSDVWLIAAMIQTIIAEGLADTETIDRHCSGWTEYAQAISTITPDVAAEQRHSPCEVDCGRSQRLRHLSTRRGASRRLAPRERQDWRKHQRNIASNAGLCRTDFWNELTRWL